MFKSKREIKLIVVWSSGSAVAGIIIVFLTLGFVLFSADQSFSITNISNIYKEHNIFYLLNLIPVFAAMAGCLAGKRVSKIADHSDKMKLAYEAIFDRTIEFVDHVKRGNLDVQFVPVNGEKVLASALESMRESIISTSRNEFERNEISRISNEISVLLQTFDEIEKLCDETIAYLVRNLENVVQGAFYIAERDNKEDHILTMKASYAYNRKKNLHAEFRFAQGLVGQAAVEKDIILRTEIPDDYVTITSGLLGDRKPTTLIISPLIYNDTVYGVIELASLHNFSGHQYDMIRELSKIIGHTIANINTNLRTYQLLQESKRMSSELANQKKQLTLKTEDLLQIQDELKKTNVKLEEQVQEVHDTSKRTQVLLENAKEVITIISDSRKVLYVSPSIKSIVGYYPEEVIGLSDIENVHPLDTERFRQLLNDLKSYPEKELTLQFRYFTKDGEVMWMEATGKNLLADSVIKGFVINSRDISEQRIAAKEQRIRAKMQALSENSSDIIIRIDIFSRCTYINPVIEEYTGMKKEAYINKPISNTGMDAQVVANLKKLLDETSRSKQKLSEEMIFPSPKGKRIMQVNAIPEFNENGESESVLYVCHEITEAKEREEVIRKKNKSISDSINYAYNIQSALMPTEENLRKTLPNSFMFYKPKDVVSGDYPWLFKNGDSIFVGAMDCTGHGVPGALMSIIGFFLQDAIIHQNSESNAGDVLNSLHRSVVERLRQAEPGSKINDGMDAAFLKIDLKKRVLHFAGAHRPLYHVSNKTLNEIKGDKFPVGSTQYKNRKEFTNHTIKFKHGDAVYFMTDGFPDQFGGETGKMKFTSDRVAQLIRDNVHLSIFQMGNLFRNTFEDWKGPINQLDDVLIIGLKF